ncbi:MAG: helix-turn-helix domain-containing protein [Candidatus Woesearchaeota archaeon]
MEAFGDRLRKIREEKGKTLNEVMEDTYIAKSTLSRYENNLSEPTLHYLFVLADYFDTTIDYLSGRTDNKYNILKENLPKELEDIFKNNETEYISAIVMAKKEGLPPWAVKKIIKLHIDIMHNNI